MPSTLPRTQRPRWRWKQLFHPHGSAGERYPRAIRPRAVDNRHRLRPGPVPATLVLSPARRHVHPSALKHGFSQLTRCVIVLTLEHGFPLCRPSWYRYACAMSRMKKHGPIGIATAIAVGISFLIMGQPRSLLRIHASRPLVLVAHAAVALAWLSLGMAAHRVWCHRSQAWMRSAHFGLCVSTFIMVVFYRWAYVRDWAGIPVQVCTNFFDGGGRHWYPLGVLMDFVFWTAVFATALAAATKLKRRCATS